MKKIITAIGILFSITGVAVLLLSFFGKVSWDFAIGLVIILALLSSAYVEYHRQKQIEQQGRHLDSDHLPHAS